MPSTFVLRIRRVRPPRHAAAAIYAAEMPLPRSLLPPPCRFHQAPSAAMPPLLMLAGFARFPPLLPPRCSPPDSLLLRRRRYRASQAIE